MCLSLDKIKELYPIGCRVRLVEMQDKYPVKKGTFGTVMDVNPLGDLEVKWDDGRSLSIILEVDRIEKVQQRRKVECQE